MAPAAGRRPSARRGSRCSAARAARSPTPTAAAIDALRADLDAFAGELALDELPERFWPVAGALLVNLRNVLAVARRRRRRAARRVPAPALAGAHPSARSRLYAALISARWVNACGKLPSASPVGPISSE